MTIKEAILKSLGDIIKPVNYKDIYQHMLSNKYYSFDYGKTPEATISALLGDFIRQNDNRVSRQKVNGGYLYYLTSNEDSIDISQVENSIENDCNQKTQNEEFNNPTNQNYNERDLHIFLSSYLKDGLKDRIYTKTIFHEKSSNNEKNKKWLHPDIVGIKLNQFKQKITENFLKVVNPKDRFKLYSYELKKTINNDYQLKEAYFQAVSNSSWANYGYLVAYEIERDLLEEMERLNQSFGIGIIELNSNPYKSKILFSAHYRDIDFKTIDKICNAQNDDFKDFIDHVEKILNITDERYYNLSIQEFDKFSDKCFDRNSDEFEEYCKQKNIPLKDEKVIDI